MSSSQRLKGIDVFVAVADYRSLTAASDHLNLTTSAVSKAIQRLEVRLGVSLFERTTRQLILTDAGHEYYKTCKSILSDLEDAELSLHETNKFIGRIRIDLPASYGRVHVLPVILKFLEKYPELEPHITLTDQFIDPIKDHVDILVRSGGTGIWPTSINHHCLGNQRLIFCASPKYLKVHGVPKTENDLEKLGCVLYAKNDGMTYPLHFSTQNSGNALRPISGKLAIGNTEGQLFAILEGYGIAQLPLWLVDQYLKDGRLIRVLPHLETDGLPIYLAWLKKRENIPKVKSLVEKLKKDLRP